MKNLLEQVIEAHGGLNQFSKFSKVFVQMKVGGVLWNLKGHPDRISDSKFEIDLKKQAGGYIDFDNKVGLHTDFDSKRVTLKYYEKVQDELLNPKESFSGHTLESKWNTLQLIYFGSYAMWSYLTTPFLFTYPGFTCKEIDPWVESGETLRRLQVTYPDGLAYHSKEQIFYFDSHGLLKRLDYNVDISGGSPAAHYVFDYKEFQGIMVPTRRIVYPRDPNGNYESSLVVVDVEITDLKFSF